MQEAKALVNMAITAMLGAVVISIAVGLIYTGYNIWALFSKQEQANQIMKEHAQLSAFDNTDVRGQEVLSLILEAKGDPFVIIYEQNASGNFTLNFAATSSATSDTLLRDMCFTEVSAGSGEALDSHYREIVTALQDPTSNLTVKDLANGLGSETAIRDESGNVIGYEYKHLSWDNSDTLAEITARLQTQFMNKGKYETTRVEEVAGVPTFATENTYGKYRSYIVYDEGNTTNIIGVILLLDPDIIRGGD